MRKYLTLLFCSIQFILKGYGQDIHSSSAVTLPQSGSTSYTVASDSTVNITSTQSVTLNSGTTFQSGSTVNISIGNPIVVIPAPSNPANDYDKNWVLTHDYDENGTEISATKVFFDNNANATQAQVKNESTGHVLATQTIYDLQQRAALTTLPAPINNSAFAFKDKFVTDAAGDNYSYTNFDYDPTNTSNPTGKDVTPDALGNSQIGSVGWYYSNNNSFEPMVGSTGYPYARGDFFNDGTGAQKRSAGAGEQLKMGSGHETMGVSFPVNNELTFYLAVRNQFFPSVAGALPTTMAAAALQSVSTDQNGLQMLTVTDLSGKALMTARADPNGSLAVTNTFSISNQQPLYVLTATNQYAYPISTLSVSSTNIVSAVCLFDNTSVTCGCTSPDYNDIGNNYSYSGHDANSYKFTSSYPFTVSETVSEAGSINPIVTIYDQTEALLQEPSGASIQYFQLTSATSVTITGSNYTLYNMNTEADITSAFASNNSLAAGYYKLVANPRQITGVNPTGINNVSITYTNKYSDISYNYYNQLGQLIGSITPKGVQSLIQNGYNSYSSASQLPFVSLYEYDLQGRLTATTSPDAGRTEYVYRMDGKIRFSQNAYQRVSTNAGTGNQEKFSYINYDNLGRPVESGEHVVPTGSAMTFASTKTNITLQENVSANGGLTDGSALSVIDTYYDLPDPDLTTANPNYTQDPGFLKGAVSYTKNANNTTWYNYDDHGRVTWVVKNIANLGVKTIDYTYNGQGNVTKVDFQKNTAAERFIHYYSYDADGRLVNVKTNTIDNTSTALQQANYYYYLHGPLKRVELGDQLQGIDYVYTPQGWLKSVNSATGAPANDPMQDGAANSFAPDAFGMQLEYFNGDYNRTGSNINSITGIFTTPGYQNYYNGNVSGMSWQSKKTTGGGSSSPTMYAYNYDPKYQLNSATWGTPNFTGNSFAGSTKFGESVTGYDPNGNITGLQRTDNTGTLDNRFGTYSYPANSNMVASVGNSTTPAAYASYSYNEIGQLKSQSANTNTPAFYSKFDVTGKMTGIYADAALTTLKISYTYDEAGNRISRTDNTGSSPVTTYYVYDVNGNIMAIYTGATQTEVPVYGSARLGIYTPGNSNYVYELRDNVGSVRVVLNRAKVSGLANVVAYNDYYPFGSIAQSGTVGSTYRYDYQGLYAQKDVYTNWNNFELRMYDGKTGRWLSTDPKNVGFSPYIGMSNNPASLFDKDGGAPPNDFVFSSDGAFERIDKTDLPDRLVVEGNDGSKSFYNFVDPINDPADIRKGILNTLVFVSEDKIKSMLKEQGAFDTFALAHFYSESKGGGKLDFSLSVIPYEFAKYGATKNPENPQTPSPVLFLAEGDQYVHNHMNFGNFLWGAAGYSEGLGLGLLQWGANYNSLHNSSTNGYPPQPDSVDDQFSIAQGVNYARRHQWNWAH